MFGNYGVELVLFSLQGSILQPSSPISGMERLNSYAQCTSGHMLRMDKDLGECRISPPYLDVSTELLLSTPCSPGNSMTCSCSKSFCFVFLANRPGPILAQPARIVNMIKGKVSQDIYI